MFFAVGSALSLMSVNSGEIGEEGNMLFSISIIEMIVSLTRPGVKSIGQQIECDNSNHQYSQYKIPKYTLLLCIIHMVTI